jgi:hypothetical protein
MNSKLCKIILGMAVLLLSVSACNFVPGRGSGHLIRETRPVSGFDTVVLSGAGRLEIIQDGTESITIETDDDVMPYVESEVRGGTLYVGLDFNGLRTIVPTEMNVTLHVRDLRRISASGAWEVTCASLETDEMEIVISGAGQARFENLQATNLTAEISGAGQIHIAGRVAAQQATISGTGQYRAGDLQSETAVVTLSGAGQATVWAVDSLDVRISGAGEVEYYGSPRISFNPSGAGNLRSLGDK